MQCANNVVPYFAYSRTKDLLHISVSLTNRNPALNLKWHAGLDLPFNRAHSEVEEMEGYLQYKRHGTTPLWEGSLMV